VYLFIFSKLQFTMTNKNNANTLQLSQVYTAKFPIFSLAYHSRSGTLILGGGGGPSRSGVPNGLLLLKLISSSTSNNSDSSKFGLQEQDELRTGDEAVMSLSLYDDMTDCLLVAGVNDRCWLLEYSPETSVLISSKSGDRISSLAQSLNSNNGSGTLKPFNLLKTIQSDTSPNDDGYLRVTRFTPSGRSVLAAGSDGCVREWTVPEMRLVNKVEEAKEEILDADGVDNLIVLVSSSGKIHTSQNNSPILNPPSKGFTFKFVRIIKTDRKIFLLTVENPVRSSLNKSSRKLQYPKISLFPVSVKDNDEKAAVEIAKTPKHVLSLPIAKNCTCFVVSDEKDLMALGFADGSILVLSSFAKKTFKSIYLWKNCAHPFPITGLAIDSKRKLLLSSSADGQVLVNPIPEQPIKTIGSSNAFFLILLVLFSILVGLSAVVFSRSSFKLPNELDDFDSFYNLFPTDLINNGNINNNNNNNDLNHQDL
jgi:hypothetical protein